MNLTQLRARYTEIQALVRGLNEVESPTEEQRSQMAELLKEGAEIRTQIETAQEQERQIAELHSFNSNPTGGRSLNGGQLNAGAFVGNGQVQTGTARNLNDEFARAWTADVAKRNNDRAVAYAASDEYRAEFGAMLRMGQGMASRAMNETLISDGGALVPMEMQREIIQRLAAPKRMYSAIRKIRSSVDSVSLPKFLGGSSTQTNGLAIQWLGEAGSAAEDTSLENWGNIEIRAHRGGFVVTCSRSLLEDSAFDLEGWVMEQIADVYAASVESLIINGSGVGRPYGILTRKGSGAEDVEGVNVGNPPTAETLVNLLGELDEQYAQNASFVMKRSTFYSGIADLRDSQGGFIFGVNNTTDGGTQARIETQLLGYPNILSDHMPSMAGAANILIYGDLRMGYALLERVSMSIEPYIDPAIQKKDQVGWYVRCRLGGDVWLPHALKVGVQS